MKMAAVHQPWVPTKKTRASQVNASAGIIQSWLSDARRLGSADNYTGKRRHQRFKWSRMINIEINPGTRHARKQTVQAKDISRTGVGIRTRESLPPNTTIRAYTDCGTSYVEGYVRHSTSTIGAYLVGVEFA